MMYVKRFLPIITLVLVVVVATVLVPTLFYRSHFLPDTALTCPTLPSTNQTTLDIGNLSIERATAEIDTHFHCPLPDHILLTLDGEPIATASATSLGLAFDFTSALEQRLVQNHPHQVFNTLLPFLETPPAPSIYPALTHDIAAVERLVQLAGAAIHRPIALPEFELLPNQQISVEAGSDGQAVIADASLNLLTANLTTFQFISPLIVEPIPWHWSEVQLATIAATLNQPAIEPVFEMENGRVTNFASPTAGRQLDVATFINTATHSGTFDLPVVTLLPQQSLEATNDLGINEVLGVGYSRYHGSPPGRVHNVAHTARILNNILVAPGEEFSFNRALGSVSAATGFQPGFIIRGNRTELAYGGGVCQVSSTLFRAMLDAGVNITLRLPHSYRVTFYELDSDPGFDATVYAGNIDLRFINDTPGHILMSMETDSRNMTMSVTFYGTSDGRTTQILDYRQWDHRPALPNEYVIDYSLAPGQRVQFDWAAAGLRTSFRNLVTAADGSIIHDRTFTSNYRPWSAKFRVGPPAYHH